VKGSVKAACSVLVTASTSLRRFGVVGVCAYNLHDRLSIAEVRAKLEILRERVLRGTVLHFEEADHHLSQGLCIYAFAVVCI
jgi:hypothetical protein